MLKFDDTLLLCTVTHGYDAVKPLAGQVVRDGAVKQARFIAEKVYIQVPSLKAYIDNRGWVIDKPEVKPQASARVRFWQFVDNFIAGIYVALYSTRLALTVDAPPVGVMLVLLDCPYLLLG